MSQILYYYIELLHSFNTLWNNNFAKNNNIMFEKKLYTFQFLCYVQETCYLSIILFLLQ